MGTIKKRIAILGSTGSIGDSALKVLADSNGDYLVVGLTTDRSIEKLALQIKQFRPQRVAIVNEAAHRQFTTDSRYSSARQGVEVLAGPEGLKEVASSADADLVLSGVVGAAGLPALLLALQKKKIVALANKEALIMAGPLVIEAAKKYGATLLPVDSEHSAMFQCIQGQNGNPIERIILTASGGPFYRYRGDLSKVTVEKALAHPNWVMGKKITIDSATLMNKGLEAIEAHFLFDVPLDRIQIVIHRQSIIHSAVEYADGSMIAQLSAPDMCLPIQYAITYPERRPCPIQKLDLFQVGRLDFQKPDFRRFPCLSLALQAGKAGGTMPAVLSAANEVAVYAFLEQRIRFTDIARVVESALTKHQRIAKPDLDEVLNADAWARRVARETVERLERRSARGSAHNEKIEVTTC